MTITSFIILICSVIFSVILISKNIYELYKMNISLKVLEIRIQNLQRELDYINKI